jgi:hypothetical protein
VTAEADKYMSTTISSASTRIMFKAECLLLGKSAEEAKIRIKSKDIPVPGHGGP